MDRMVILCVKNKAQTTSLKTEEVLSALNKVDESIHDFIIKEFSSISGGGNYPPLQETKPFNGVICGSGEEVLIEVKCSINYPNLYSIRVPRFDRVFFGRKMGEKHKLVLNKSFLPGNPLGQDVLSIFIGNQLFNPDNEVCYTFKDIKNILIEKGITWKGKTLEKSINELCKKGLLRYGEGSRREYSLPPTWLTEKYWTAYLNKFSIVPEQRILLAGHLVLSMGDRLKFDPLIFFWYQPKKPHKGAIKYHNQRTEKWKTRKRIVALFTEVLRKRMDIYGKLQVCFRLNQLEKHAQEVKDMAEMRMIIQDYLKQSQKIWSEYTLEERAYELEILRELSLGKLAGRNKDYAILLNEVVRREEK